ncbi:MAG: chain X [Campylobacteraceae bacterium]|nr:chain X [Campylobacteraceae bacterium]
MKRFLFLVVLLVFGGCSLKNDIKKEELKSSEKEEISVNFEIYNANLGSKISYESLINELKNSDIVLLGEVHNDKSHHFFQNMVINSLNDDISVVFEMIDIDKQGVVSLAKQNKKSISKSELPKSLEWQKGWDYELYKEIVESVFYSDKKMIAGNLTKNEIKNIYKEMPSLKGELSTSNFVKDSLKSVIKDAHKEFMSNLSDEFLDKMVLVQIHKDRRMAERLLEQPNLAILLAGRFHTDKTLGVPTHIKDATKNKRVVVVGLGYEDENLTSSSRNSADFLVIFKH